MNIQTNKEHPKTAIIFGIAGQDGFYLSELLLEKGYRVFGADLNCTKYSTQNKITYVCNDVTDEMGIGKLINTIRPDEIYNLAAQSDVKLSFAKPTYTAQVNAIGTLNILEAIRDAGLSNKTKFYQASSSEMFGTAQAIPQNEKTPFCPRSPYGISKLYAFWIGVNYRETYGMFVSNGILFNHESPYRGTNFVSRVISQGVAKIKLGLEDNLKIGNLNAKRDWGYAKDYVQAMWLMLQQDIADDYVIASGETHSVREFVELAFKEIGIDILWHGTGLDEIGIDKKSGKKLVFVDTKRFRITEIESLVGDSSKAQKKLGWQKNISFDQLVKILVNADIEQLSKTNVWSVTEQEYHETKK